MIKSKHQRAQEILESLANSVYDRNPNTSNPLFFSINEIHIVEKWIETLHEDFKRLSVATKPYTTLE